MKDQTAPSCPAVFHFRRKAVAGGFRLLAVICLLFLVTACDKDKKKKEPANNVNNQNNVNNVNNINNVNNQNNQNPCDDSPCENAGLHRQRCVPAEGEPGHVCLCDEGFEESPGGGCKPSVREECPVNTICRADLCVPDDEPQGQCITDFDCHVILTPAEGNMTACNPAIVGGVCTGCREGFADCPPGFECTPFGSCAKPCGAPEDCLFGPCAMGVGFCTFAACTSDAECLHGTVCADPDNDGTGRCLRLPCVDETCSVYNPGGQCPQGSSCMDGSCVDSCVPNPCTGTNRRVCQETDNGPRCLCDPGYAENENGDCVWEQTSTCPAGLGCRDGYCVDPLEPFACVVNADCGGSMICSPNLPSRTCNGCTLDTDCPEGFGKCLAGYCLRACNAQNPCPAGMSCNGSYCGRKVCSTSGECGDGYQCVSTGTESVCHRYTCES